MCVCVCVGGGECGILDYLYVSTQSFSCLPLQPKKPMISESDSEEDFPLVSYLTSLAYTVVVCNNMQWSLRTRDTLEDNINSLFFYLFREVVLF